MKLTMAEAFNEWMRRYISNPKEFAAEFESVTAFLATEAGKEPSYGEACVAYLNRLMEVQA